VAETTTPELLEDSEVITIIVKPPNEAPDAPPDADLDGVPDTQDNCPAIANGDQSDSDGDGLGDACDELSTQTDGQPTTGDPNVDGEAVCQPPTGLPDLDGDGVRDSCDPDVDGDGILNEVDNCVWVINTSQRDWDEDGRGDACDEAPTDAQLNTAGTTGSDPDADTTNTASAPESNGWLAWLGAAVALAAVFIVIIAIRRRRKS
jgi:hypothetical protein